MTERRHVPIAKVIIGDEAIAAVVEVLRSGNLREGSQCSAFEEEFARTVGSVGALTSSSGTSALQIAYQALLRPGDEVLVPTFTFAATATMVLAVGAVPVFCDISAETLTIDVTAAEQHVTPRTRAIAPVHLFGNPANVRAVQKFARQHALAVIWDAAQAHGTKYDGQDIGSHNDLVCYSFYSTKNMTTGEGGMICANDHDLLAKMKLIRSQGQARKYWHTVLGYNFRMTDMQAAIGRWQLRELPTWISQRRQNAAYLRQRFRKVEVLRVQDEQPHGTHSYHQFSVVLDEHIERDMVVDRLRAYGVESAVHYPIPLHQQPLFSAGATPRSLPVSEETAGRIFSLPVHPYLTSEDLEYVADCTLRAVEFSG